MARNIQCGGTDHSTHRTVFAGKVTSKALSDHNYTARKLLYDIPFDVKVDPTYDSRSEVAEDVNNIEFTDEELKTKSRPSSPP